MNSRIFYFLISYLISLVLALNFQAIPPLIPFIIESWGITRSQAGLLMGIVALPPMIFGIIGGYILDRFGNRLPTILALSVYLLGETLFVLAQNFTILILSRVILGFGGIILAVVGLRILAEKFQGENLGKAIGFWSTGMPFAVLISFNLFSFIASKFSWKTPIVILMVFTILVLTLIILFYREEKRNMSSNIELFSSIRNMPREVWFLALVWLLFNAGSLSFLTFAPDYFTSRGLPATQASSVSSLYMIGSFFSPIIGYILDRNLKPNLIIFSGTVLLSIFLVLVYFVSSPIIIICAGISSVLIPPSVFYLLPKLTDKFGLGYSILSSFINFGTVFSPYLIGYAKDLSGNYLASFLLMSVFIILAGIISLGLKSKGEYRSN